MHVGVPPSRVYTHENSLTSPLWCVRKRRLSVQLRCQSALNPREIRAKSAHESPSDPQFVRVWFVSCELDAVQSGSRSPRRAMVRRIWSRMQHSRSYTAALLPLSTLVRTRVRPTVCASVCVCLRVRARLRRCACACVWMRGRPSVCACARACARVQRACVNMCAACVCVCI